MNKFKKYLAEAIGTFTIIFCGCGAMISQDNTGVISHPGVAVTWGLSVMVMIYAFGSISGGHFNPAVTLAFTIGKKHPKNQLLQYISAQLIGGILAAMLLKFLFASHQNLGGTFPKIPTLNAFILEAVLTFFLMVVIYMVSEGKKEVQNFAGIAIGAVILLESMFAGPLTNASMNPARSIAPALVSGNLDQLWIYCTAPFTGAIIAVFTCKYLKQTN